MAVEQKMYHSPAEHGFWTQSGMLEKNITLNDGSVLMGVVPSGLRQVGDVLEMVLSTFEGDVFEPVDNFPGLRAVRGDSSSNPNEAEGELLIEIHYLKMDEMEGKKRRIRPTGIKFGILGGTYKADAEKGWHRAMGESADYYLEGHDTQYLPGNDGKADMRFFPFWRIGVWGDQLEMAKEWLPEPQSK